jgi:hypothetical protein
MASADDQFPSLRHNSPLYRLQNIEPQPIDCTPVLIQRIALCATQQEGMMPSQISQARGFDWLWRCALDCLATGVVCAAVLMLLVRLLA